MNRDLNNGLLEACFEQAASALLIYDLEGCVIRVNRAMCRLSGLVKEDYAQINVLDDPERDTLVISERQQRELLAKGGLEFETEFRNADGRGVVASVRCSILESEEGKYCLAEVRDVTAAQERHSAMAESEQRLQRLVDQVPAIVYTADIGESSPTTFISQRYWDILGLNPESAVNDPDFWVKRLHPDDRERVQQELASSHRQGNRFESEYRFRHANGEYLWIRDEAEVIRDENGRALYIQGIMRDVTRRRQAEHAVRESERRLKESEKLARVGHWELDLRSNHLIWSDEVYAIFEIDADQSDLSYETFLQVVHPEDRELVDQAYRDSVANHSQYGIDHRLLLKGGRVCFVHEEGKTSYDADGTPLRSIGTVQDITERKRAEEAVQQAYEQLEQRVEERTAELAEAKEQAETAVRFKSAFLATMSHEFRTPLNSIIGFSTVLLKEMAGPLNPEQAKQLGMIKGRADHLLGLLTDVLDLSRIEAGKLTLHPKEFDVIADLRECFESVHLLAKDKGLELNFRVPDGRVVVLTDRRRLEQIVLNLLSNAVKFTSTGSVTVSLEGDESHFHITVADTGPGIAKDDRRWIFETFSQGRIGSQRRHPGSGLGLSISRELADLLGGEIRLETEIGHGSRFTLSLPRRIPESLKCT